MRFYFDENLPPTIAEAIGTLQKTDPDNDAELAFIPDEFDYGVPDEVWIPAIGENGSGTIITCDHQIHRRKDQRLLYQENGLGLVVIKPPSKKGLRYWQQVEKIVTNWEQILEYERDTQKPYLLLLKMRGSPELVYNGRNWRDV